jgi:hypothetical protein
MKRRDFLRTVASSGLVMAASDLVGDLIAQSPPGKPLGSQFKGLADVALAEAKRNGCTYADIRFTRRTNSSVNANGGNSDFEGLATSAVAADAVGAAAGADAAAAEVAGASAARTRPRARAQQASASG